MPPNRERGGPGAHVLPDELMPQIVRAGGLGARRGAPCVWGGDGPVRRAVPGTADPTGREIAAAVRPTVPGCRSAHVATRGKIPDIVLRERKISESAGRRRDRRRSSCARALRPRGCRARRPEASRAAARRLRHGDVQAIRSGGAGRARLRDQGRLECQCGALSPGFNRNPRRLARMCRLLPSRWAVTEQCPRLVARLGFARIPVRLGSSRTGAGARR